MKIAINREQRQTMSGCAKRGQFGAKFNTFKLFVIAALGLVTFACTNDDNEVGLPDETQTDMRKTPMTMEALTDGSIVVIKPEAGMQYSMNGGPKIKFDGTTTIDNLKAGDKVQFYGDGTNISCYWDTAITGGTAMVKVYGNIMSLLDEEHFDEATEITGKEAFERLFFKMPDKNTTLIDASGLLLPATTLKNACYIEMFRDCIALTAAPKLPATTLAENCYAFMFYGCTSLKEAPELPATTLAGRCYLEMFEDCYSLTKAPELPATKLESACYYGMFRSCKSLTEAPKLSATTLEPSCYCTMFSGCTSLKEAPELPAMKLAPSCYGGMFSYCISLTEAPELKAEKLEKSCYQFIFYDCKNLSKVTCLATDNSAEECTFLWMVDAGSDVEGQKTFITPSTTTWSDDEDGIPSDWTRVDYVAP